MSVTTLGYACVYGREDCYFEHKLKKKGQANLHFEVELPLILLNSLSDHLDGSTESCNALISIQCCGCHDVLGRGYQINLGTEFKYYFNPKWFELSLVNTNILLWACLQLIASVQPSVQLSLRQYLRIHSKRHQYLQRRDSK